MAQNNRWSDQAKRQFLDELKRGDSHKSMARRYGLATSTVKAYESQFKSDLYTLRASTNGAVDVTARAKLPNFDPQRLRRIRGDRGYTRYELASKVGLPSHIIEGFELGKYAPYVNGASGGPAPVHRIARALGITVADLQVSTRTESRSAESGSQRDESARLDAIERKLSKLLDELGVEA